MNFKLNRIFSNLKYQDVFAFFLFAAVFIFLLWNARYSYFNEDESFYYAIPLRLVLGDSLLTDEWLHVQLFGFLLYLPVKAFIHFTGSTEGIALFFRYFYIAFQSAVSVAVYCRIRRYGVFSIFAVLINWLHIPFTFMAMSYNTMGLAFVVLCGVLIATTNKYSRLTFYIVGLLFACAVLCNPLLAFIYMLYTGFVMFNKATLKKGHSLYNFPEISFSLKTWRLITFGISTVTAVFIIFLLSRASIKEILDNLPMLFSNPWLSHSGSGKMTFINSITILFNYYPYQFTVYGILMFVIVLDKNRIIRRPFYIAVVSIIYFAFIAQIIHSPVLPGYEYFFLMLPLSLVGLTCYFLLENKNKRLFVFIWMFGVLYAICLTITSTTGPYAATYGLGVSDIASVIFIKNLIDELRKQNKSQDNLNYVQKKMKIHVERLNTKIITAVLISTLILQVGSEIYIKADLSRYSIECAFASYHSNSKVTLNTAIEVGPLKGIITTSETAKLYSNMINDLSVIKENNDNKPVLIALQCWFGYLYLDMPFSAYTEEYYSFDDGSRLMKYYELHPEKVPGYIYIPKIRDLGYDSYNENPTDVLADIIENYNCIVKESDAGYVVKVINRYQRAVGNSF